LPETSGQVLAQQLRTSYPGLRCLYLSGYFPGSSLETSLGEGAHFLQKPFSRNDLASKVRQALAAGTPS
jgi:FixJ family two-component response regulator